MKSFLRYFHEQPLRFRLSAITAGLLLLVVSLLTGITGFYSAKTLKTALDRKLTEDVRRGSDLFFRFHEEIRTKLELWNSQPIVQVFFNNPALASVSHSGLAAFFRKVRDKEPWIADILLTDQGKIRYEDSGIPGISSSEYTDTITQMLASQVLTPILPKDGNIPLLLIRHPFSVNGVIQPGKHIVLVADPQQISENLFGRQASGTHGFVTLAVRCPDNTFRVLWSSNLINREFAPDSNNAVVWQSLSDISDRYPSIMLRQEVIPESPLIAVGIASREEIRKPMTNLIFISLLIGLLVCLVGILGSLVLARTITAPLTALTSKAGSFLISVHDSAGEMTESDNSGDEIGILENVFKIMFERIRDYTITLEEKVSQRTQELELANRKMRNEIAERKRAEEAAEAANRAKSIFLANMSHELRSPLTAILGFARVMTRSRTFPEEHLENAGIIARSGEHLLTLINQVLDLSKIEAGRITLNESSFELHRLLNDMEDMFRMRAEDKHLNLLFERSPDVPRYVRTDEVKLRQVLINLLNNAVKFTNEGGIVVRVGVGSDLTTFEKLSNLVVSNLAFEIEDTGPGISSDELDNLFEAFVQTKTGRQSQEGTGLGLAISRKFVRLMGGDLTVRSEPGRGSVFSFGIRAEKAETADVETVRSDRRVIALEPGQPRHRILIVDDSAVNRRLLAKQLDPLGFGIREAENGKQAVEIWEQWEPHLIWMDIRMPVMDGYEATRQIKSVGAGLKPAPTTVIALTASVFEEEKALVLSAGCDDFLRKPYRESEIFEAMEKHLGMRFVWEENTPEDRKPEPKEIDSRMTSEAMNDLSTEMLSALRQAAIRGDSEAVGSLIEAIRSSNASLADSLKTLADDFEFDRILELISEKDSDHQHDERL